MRQWLVSSLPRGFDSEYPASGADGRVAAMHALGVQQEGTIGSFARRV
jgi:hypothetical protein